MGLCLMGRGRVGSRGEGRAEVIQRSGWPPLSALYRQLALNKLLIARQDEQYYMMCPVVHTSYNAQLTQSPILIKVEES